MQKVRPLLNKEVFCVMIKKSPIKKISFKKQARISSWLSERALFLRLIKERKRTDTSGRPITEENAQSFQFAHILPKGMYPELRLNPNNIIIVDSINQHHWVDKMVAWFKHEFYEFVMRGTAIKALHDLYVSEFSWLE